MILLLDTSLNSLTVARKYAQNHNLILIEPCLTDKNNYVKTEGTIYFTSVADLGLQNILELMMCQTQFIFAEQIDDDNSIVTDDSDRALRKIDEFEIVVPKNINKIVAFGCSHTYGENLENNFSYVHYLGKLLNLPIENHAKIGKGQDYIFHHLFKTDLTDSLVVVQFSDAYRRQITETSNVNSYNYSKNQALCFTKEWTVYHNKNIMQACCEFLKTKKLPYMITLIAPHHEEEKLLIEFLLGKENFFPFEHAIDNLPCGHFGPKTHKQFADHIFSKIIC